MSKATTLIIDGEYFLITFRNLFGNEEPTAQFVELLLQVISVETMASLKINKYFFCGCPQGEYPHSHCWKKLGFIVDVRTLKKEVEKCSKCNLTKCKLTEAEVDVAIGVRIAREALGREKPLSIIIVGGDRDYIDGISLAIEQGISTFIIGDKNSVSYRYKEKPGLICLLFLSYMMKKCHDFMDGFTVMYKAISLENEYYYKMKRTCKGRSFLINIINQRDKYCFD